VRWLQELDSQCLHILQPLLVILASSPLARQLHPVCHMGGRRSDNFVYQKRESIFEIGERGPDVLLKESGGCGIQSRTASMHGMYPHSRRI